jgi:DDE_Tnp_1-associated
VPADPSSSILSGLTQLRDAGPLRPADTPDLLAYLATVNDPRTRAGRRHPLVTILAIAAAAVLTGARSIAAIAEWAADTPQPVRAALGARRDPLTGRWTVPTETTIRRTLARLDPETFAAVVGAWLADRDQPGQRRRPAVAVDGKTLRGARRDGARFICLLRWTIRPARCWPNAKSTVPPTRSPGSSRCWLSWTSPGAVVTADALHTHRAAAEFLVAGKHAHYLFIVKANQPALHTRCARMPWHRVPELDRTRDRGHGRVELRTLMAVTVGGFGFPHAAQVIQVTRKTRDLGARRWRTMTVYAVTSLTMVRPALPGWLISSAGTGRSRTACTGSATSPSTKTLPSSAPAPARTSWPAYATSPSGSSAERGRPTWLLRYVTTAATPPDPSRPRDHPGDETGIRQNAGALPSHHPTNDRIIPLTRDAAGE